MKNPPVKHIILGVAAGVLAGAVSFVMPSLLLLMPALFAAMGTLLGVACMTTGLCAGCIACAALGMAGSPDPVALISAIASFAPASLIIYFTLTTRGAYRTAVSLTAVASGIALYISNCLPALLEGLAPFAYFEDYTRAIGAELVNLVNSDPALLEVADEIALIAATASARASSAAALSMAGIAMAAGLINVVLAYAIVRRRGAMVKPMAPFYMWQLSRSFVYGCLILLLGALVVSMSGMGSASDIVAVLHTIVLAPYALMGACLLAYARKKRVRSGLFFTLSIVALALLLPYSLYGLGFMGAFDRILHARRRPPR